MLMIIYSTFSLLFYFPLVHSSVVFVNHLQSHSVAFLIPGHLQLALLKALVC